MRLGCVELSCSLGQVGQQQLLLHTHERQGPPTTSGIPAHYGHPELRPELQGCHRTAPSTHFVCRTNSVFHGSSPSGTSMESCWLLRFQTGSHTSPLDPLRWPAWQTERCVADRIHPSRQHHHPASHSCSGRTNGSRSAPSWQSKSHPQPAKKK